MSQKLIILFDFDGVIITQRSLEYSASIFLKRNFYKWKNTENIRLIDLARFFEESDSKSKWTAFKQINRVYKHFIPSFWRRNIFFINFRRTYPKFEKYETLTPNLDRVLKELKKKDIPLGIVSNTSSKRLEYFKRKLHLEKYFTVFISRDESPVRKPNAYPIILALKELKKRITISIDKNTVYYIGDLPSDIECAKNAEIKSIALLSGHGKKEDMEKSNPTIILEDIKEILEIEQFKKLLFK